MLDYSKAFDCINHTCLLQKLYLYYNFSNTNCKLLASLLEGRSQITKFKNELSKPLNVSHGLCQGIVLAPTLFSLFINDQQSRIHHCVPHYFADISQLSISGPWADHASIINLLNNDLLIYSLLS
jgi:hypothetical protein